jgi:hypothetical protein
MVRLILDKTCHFKVSGGEEYVDDNGFEIGVTSLVRG